MKLNTFYLKLIAVVLMIVDHIAHFLIPVSDPAYLVMRVIGRLAAPLFWYCFVEGFKHTSNRQKYIGRLGVAAGIMSIGNLLISKIFALSSISSINPNIFLTMFFMALLIECIERTINSKKGSVSVGYLSLATLIGLVVGCVTEYGWIALVSILCLYFVRPKSWKYVLFICFNIIICILESNFIQPFMVFTVPLMLLCSPEKPKRNMKWFFYVFYPIHIWVLAIIQSFV